ncbi:hypothetical protein N7524_001151 [Penicillium chrysogenum]|nr:hypothetical protein N7524_001151 [Penicillium chrysogenum]
MAYYEDRRYREPRDRYARASYADPYDDPRGRYRRHERDSYVPRASTDSIEEVQRDYPQAQSMPTSVLIVHVDRGDPCTKICAVPPPSADTTHTTMHLTEAPVLVGQDTTRINAPVAQNTSLILLQAVLHPATDAASPSRGERGRGRSPSRHRHRHRSYSRSPSDSRSPSRHRGGSKRDKSEQRIAQAARAALTAGAVEAFKQRKEPGDWAGSKGKRVLTAAVTAGGTDGLVDKDPNKHEKRHVIESTLAGLAASHFVNGSRSQSRGRDGGRSSSGGLKNLAATGALAAAGKEIYDRYSKSRSRPRGRNDSRDSNEERGSHKRSKSVSEYISKGMAALGLGEEEDRRDSRDRKEHHREHRPEHRDDRERRHRRGHRRDYSDSDSDTDSDYYNRGSRRGKSSRDVGRHHSLDGTNPPPLCTHQRLARSDEKKQRKKLKRDMLVTGGLASVATIHAAHSIYGSMEKRKQRQKQLKEGEITPEEARKHRMKANTKDAVSIGLAALGIKGAYSEWKEVMEKNKENTHFREECAQRAVKRERRRARSQAAPSRHHRWPDEIEYAPSTNDSRSDHGTFYRDGNPYGAHEAPQISY